MNCITIDDITIIWNGEKTKREILEIIKKELSKK